MEWIAKAVMPAGDVDALATLRAGMRDRLLTSPLCDGAAFTRRLEATYRRLWQCCRSGTRAGPPQVEWRLQSFAIETIEPQVRSP